MGEPKGTSRRITLGFALAPRRPIFDAAVHDLGLRSKKGKTAKHFIVNVWRENKSPGDPHPPMVPSHPRRQKGYSLLLMGQQDQPDVLIDVVVPTLGRWQFVAEAIAAIEAQVDVATRVILVNDSGKTAPRELAERVLVLNTPGHIGEGAARQLGLDAVTSDLVAFCDDDDRWKPGKLARQINALGESSGWCLTAAERVDTEGNHLDSWSLERLIQLQATNTLTQRLLTHNPVPAGPSSVLVTTDLLHSVGGWDERMRYFADWDCWIRLTAAAEPVLLDEELLTYRVWPGQMIGDRSGGWIALDHIRDKHETQRRRLGVGPLDDRVIAWILAGELRTPGRRLAGIRAAGSRLLPRHPRDLRAIGRYAGELWPFRQRRHDRHRRA